MALQSTYSSTPRELEALAVTETSTSPIEHESRNDFSEPKEMIAKLATMRKIYAGVPHYLGVKIRSIRNGSIIVNHDVLFQVNNTASGAEYNTVLVDIEKSLNESVACENAYLLWQTNSLQTSQLEHLLSLPGRSNSESCSLFNLTGGNISVQSIPINTSELCKSLVHPDIAPYYISVNTSLPLQCISVCDRRHKDYRNCNNGQCQLENSGPVCYCRSTSSHWYSGSHCQVAISKVGLYIGLSLAVVVILTALTVLIVYLYMYKNKMYRIHHSNVDRIEQWYEEDFVWCNPKVQTTSVTQVSESNWTQLDEGTTSSMEGSSHEVLVSIRLNKVMYG
ncbi:mucin-3A [Polypterus senegalus]|uniref:mucin-3A n=1 Tax=Polypterus senegalus TaxID=55291 RepID=UPI0019656BD6|nr:mucin-3A [Polypterus senegalus]